MKELKRILSYTRRAVDDYDMIEEGDKIAVGVSAGKDSLALLYALAELIEQLTGRKVEVVADPTMLVAAEKWREIARKPSWLKGDEQILTTYFLGKRPDEIINRLADEYGLKVVNILDEHVFEHYAVAPEEWLWLIDHAKLMYTDSFHGTVFSILFRRPFVVAERIEAGCASKMTSRIDTLLGKFALEGRRGTKENGYMIDNPMEIQYGDVDGILAAEKVKAISYLHRALELKE